MGNKKLLEAINAKKEEVISLANEGKIEEATAAKEELKALQAQYDLLQDIMDDPEGEEAQNLADGAENAQQNDAIHEFAQAARDRFQNMNREGGETGIDGGYTVPEDIQTQINRYREAEFSLQSLVSTEAVTAPSGQRTYLKRASHTGFANVLEGGKIGSKSGPQFERINYTIKKYAGYLPVTNELLADSDAAIANLLIEWLGKEDVATRNALILAKVAQKTQTEFSGLDDIKKAVNVTLGQIFAMDAAIITNDDGLNYLDTLKDKNDRYLLQPDINPASPFDMTLAVGARKIPVIVVPNAILATSSNKIPMIVGDLKEYVKIFDRQQLSIMQSNTAVVGSGQNALNAYEEDLTLFRGIIRLDAEVLDASAIVNGYITVTGESGETGETGNTGETGSTGN